MNRDGTSVKGQVLGQLVNSSHCPPYTRPFAFMVFVQLSTLRKIAGSAGVFDQAGGEEMSFVLKCWRIADQVLELSVNLLSV